MIRSGQKLLPVLLLLPILTILAHNSIPHHHHASPVEICCANHLNDDAARYLLNLNNNPPAGHHDACCFNPEFTIDLYKILITAAGSDHVQIVCPLKWIEYDYLNCITDDALCRISPAINFLRGPPSIG
ncbi:MAG: hypothetical protein NTV01_04210 [Bacteroidia bacterium]|nr:hypothetical protein [Bacteroidia bacterium]